MSTTNFELNEVEVFEWNQNRLKNASITVYFTKKNLFVGHLGSIHILCKHWTDWVGSENSH